MDDHQLIPLFPALHGRHVTLSALGGGLTNRNYRVGAGAETFVLRVAGRNTGLLGIERACEVACARAAAALGVGPEVIDYLPEHEAILWRFVPGRALAPEDVREAAVLRRVVAALRRCHQGPPGAGIFSPFNTVRTYHALARDRGLAFPTGLEPALKRLAGIERDLVDDAPPCPCHNDLLAGNLIDDGEAIRIIDWEYGGMGSRWFDLGNLAANNEFEERHEQLLLEVYSGEVRPPDLRRLRLMRLVSDMREALWGFAQAAVSTLDLDYAAYGRKHLDRFLILSDRWHAPGPK